jgi:hypothetical protein
VLWHFLVGSCFILGEGDASSRLDRCAANGPIGASARQDYTDRSVLQLGSQGTQQCINRHRSPFPLGTLMGKEFPLFEHQLCTRSNDVDPVGGNRYWLLDLLYWHFCRMCQQYR